MINDEIKNNSQHLEAETLRGQKGLNRFSFLLFLSIILLSLFSCKYYKIIILAPNNEVVKHYRIEGAKNIYFLPRMNGVTRIHKKFIFNDTFWVKRISVLGYTSFNDTFLIYNRKQKKINIFVKPLRLSTEILGISTNGSTSEFASSLPQDVAK